MVEILLSFARQAAILISTMVVYGLLAPDDEQTGRHWIWQLLGGFMSGLLGCLLMVTPWILRPGLFFDARGVLLALAGLYFHPPAALLTAAMMAVFRYLQGGIGAWPGIGFILSAFALGFLWRYWFDKALQQGRRYGVLFSLGLVTHLVMLGWQLTLPADVRWQAVRSTAAPILLVFPLATLLVGLVLENRRAHRHTMAALRESELRYRLAVELSPDGIAILQAEKPVFANRRFLELLGVASMTALWQKPLDALFGWENRERVAGLLRQGNGEIADLGFQRPDGMNLSLSVRLAPVQYQGEAASYLLVHDHTEEERARAAVAERLAELETLFGLVSGLSRVSTTQGALDLTLDAVLFSVHSRDGAIWLYHPSDGKLHAHGARGWFRDLNETPLVPGEGIGGHVFATGKTHVSADFTEDPMTRKMHLSMLPKGYGGACLPLWDENTCIGVLFVALPKEMRLSEHQLRLLESFLAIAGTHIQRLRLLDENRQRVQYLEAIQAIDNIVLTSWDLKLLFGLVLEQAKQILSADAANFWLYEPSSHFLELVATHGVPGLHIGLIRSLDNVLLDVMLQSKVRYGEQALLSRQYAPQDAVFGVYLPLVARGEPLGLLELFMDRKFRPDSNWLEFVSMFAKQISLAIESNQTFERLQQANQELMQAYEKTVEGWAQALDLRDHETEGHTRRVTEATVLLARTLGVPDEEIVHIRRGALLHDIGKMGVPDEILHKPGPLTPEEDALMRQHPIWARKLLEPIAYLRPAIDIPYCHHERWDGSGYPQGLKGLAIPFSARIFAVVDVWDALSNDRPYRKAWSTTAVRKYLQERSGTDFDPKVVQAFLALLDSGKLNKILLQQHG